MSWSVLRSFIISRALVVLFAILGYLLLTSVHYGLAVDLPQSTPWYLSIWYQWDSHWYMSISADGYQWIAGDQSNVAFFPLYPILVRYIGNLMGGRYLETGLVLSSLFMLAGMTYLYKLIKIDYSETVARRAVWFVAIFPTSVFFSSFYTESLFLLTSVATFYYARRGRWAWAGFWGFLAALTRVTGIFILLPLAYEYLSQRSFSLKQLRPSLLWITMVPAGLLTYMVFLYFSFGLPLAFAETQVSGWGHELTSFTSSLTHDLSILAKNWEFWVVYEMAAAGLLLAMIMAGIIRKMRGSYIFYMIISLVFPLLGGTTKSMSRYLLVVFPIFILMAQMTERKAARWVLSAASIALMGAATAAFVTGRWVA